MCRVVLPAYGAGPYLPAIVMERPVYVREMSDGLYSPLTYLLYKVCCKYTSNAQALSLPMCKEQHALPSGSAMDDAQQKGAAMGDSIL